jgi:ABC-type multidrug transport system fused ATPase/permease subunit
MDPKTDQKIHDNLFKLAQDKTLIVITHRLENIEIYDRVIVLEDGKIVQDEKGSEIKKNP